MKAQDLIMELLPYKNHEVVICDQNDTVISSDIGVSISSYYLAKNDDKLSISAIKKHADDKHVVAIFCMDYYNAQ